MTEIADETNIRVQKLQHLPPAWKDIEVDMLRADLIHATLSGNKWFKLKYHLKEAQEKGFKGLATFGGAFSNHIHATAYAANQMGWQSMSVVRGERPAVLSPTLMDCEQYGSHLLFVERSRFRDPTALQMEMTERHPDYYWIPEGGRSLLGMKGIPEMLAGLTISDYTHVCCAVGTGTMMAGIASVLNKDQQLIGIPVLHIEERSDQTLLPFVRQYANTNRLYMAYGYHEVGYARHTPKLIHFINEFQRMHRIPLDFVYTGKLCMAVYDMANRGFFTRKSKILLIHSGGIQGNRSIHHLLSSDEQMKEQ